jgi:cytochrome c oxidase subunit 2
LDRNKHLELFARGIVGGIMLGLVAFIALMRYQANTDVIELHGVMSENGGWTPADLSLKVGETVRLRLISDDVMHGFAVGQQEWPAIDMKPGQPVETEIVFNQPGKYTYYCTRWCGPNHWRMRGVIEVEGEPGAVPASPDPPLYVTLDLDLDAPHPAANLPERKPEAGVGDIFSNKLPSQYLEKGYYQTHSPDQAWSDLRAESSLASLDDVQIWDLVATIWQSQTTSEKLEEGRILYAANCAACHGEAGAGDGVMAENLSGAGFTATATAHTEGPDTNHDEMTQAASEISGHTTTSPTNFNDPGNMLGASPALLYGKIVRGGMGTGMPYWGPIFTDDQIWSLVAYLWTFQFEYR